MNDKDFFTLDTPHFRIEGRSRAGHETYFRIRDLGIALDIGRCPDLIIGTQHVFITHAHLDHSVGIPFYAGQRRLQHLGGGRIYVPEEAAAGIRELLAIHERLIEARFEEVEVIGLREGDTVRIGRTHEVRVHRSTHRVPANAYEVLEIRHRLRDALAGSTEEELAERRRRGERVVDEVRWPLLFYTGDTDRGLLERSAELYKSEVLMIECSFVADGDQGRAAQYRHIHFDDLSDFAERFENRTIVLTHFSRRYGRDQIRDEIARRCPAVLRERIRLALPEPFQRLP